MNESTPLRARKEDDRSGIVYQAIELPTLSQPEPILSSSTPSTFALSSYISDSSSLLAEVGSSIHSQLRESQSTLVRSVSNRILPRPTVFCGICLEHVDKSEVYSFTGGTLPKGLETCGHEYCKECLKSYLRSQIIEFNPDPSCPFTDPLDQLEANTQAAEAETETGFGCTARASDIDVKFILKDDEKILEKYNRVVQLKSNKNFRECPQCNHLQLPERDFLKRIKNSMTCEKCSLQYCFEHSNQHPNESCLEFIRRSTKDEVASTDYMRQKLRVKACPSCSFPTEKNRGCNHMVCASCRADWCWLCGQDISLSTTGQDVDVHFSPTNIRGCPGSQFTNGNGDYMWLDRLTSIIWWLIFTAVLLASTLGYCSALVALCLSSACCFGCCCGNCQRIQPEAFHAIIFGPPLFLALFAMTLLWVVIGLVWSVVLAPIFLITSVIWLPMISAGWFDFGDVLRLWGFCGIYVYNSMAVQMVLHGGDM